jgi:hypothetical protein
MHSDKDVPDDAPLCSKARGSIVECSQESDEDGVARDIEEDFVRTLDDFQMEKEDLSSGMEDSGSNCSDRAQSHADYGIRPLDSWLR